MNRYLDQNKTVIDFGTSRPTRALERLNRLTGLYFADVPQSLVKSGAPVKAIPICPQSRTA